MKETEYKPPEHLGEVSYVKGVELVNITNMNNTVRRNRKMVQALLNIDKYTAESLGDEFNSKFYDTANIMLTNYSTVVKDKIKIDGITYILKDEVNVEDYIDIDTAFKRFKNIVEIGAIVTGIMYGIPLELIQRDIDTGYLSVFYTYVVKDKQVLNEEFPTIFGDGDTEEDEPKVRGFGQAEFTTAEIYGWYDTLFNLCNEDIIQIDRWYKKPIREFLVYVSWRVRKADEDMAKGGSNGR